MIRALEKGLFAGLVALSAACVQVGHPEQVGCFVDSSYDGCSAPDTGTYVRKDFGTLDTKTTSSASTDLGAETSDDTAETWDETNLVDDSDAAVDDTLDAASDDTPDVTSDTGVIE